MREISFVAFCSRGAVQLCSFFFALIDIVFLSKAHFNGLGKQTALACLFVYLIHLFEKLYACTTREANYKLDLHFTFARSSHKLQSIYMYRCMYPISELSEKQSVRIWKRKYFMKLRLRFRKNNTTKSCVLFSSKIIIIIIINISFSSTSSYIEFLCW